MSKDTNMFCELIDKYRNKVKFNNFYCFKDKTVEKFSPSLDINERIYLELKVYNSYVSKIKMHSLSKKEKL